MDWLVTGRNHLQALTLVFVIASMLMMLLMWRRGVLPWRVTVLPGLILIQLAAFYVYILVLKPSPGETLTAWAAAIRLETVVAFFMYLVIYHWSKRG